ncbi:MAG: OmpA family protein [Alphaproteobacteria bacterium]|nr:OmpA family protein [Alphaproteobacteria bacterium]
MKIKIFYAFTILILLSGCQSSFTPPEKGEWGNYLEGSSFGMMTESRKQSRNTALKQAGFSAQDPTAYKETVQKDFQDLKDALEPQNVRVHLIGRDLILTVFSDNIFENRLSMNFKSSARNILSDISRYLGKNKNTYVEITGYTDSVGDANANQRLSMEKAQRLTLFFTQEGHSPLRFFINGNGENAPIANDSDPNLRKMNRRVDLRISPIIK